MRKWFCKRAAVLMLVPALLCALFIQASKSQNLRNDQDRPRIEIARSFQARATAGDRGVLIVWRTGLEPDSLGFNIYRVTGGQRTQINSGLIAGSALIAPQQTERGSYSWLDRDGTLASEYVVESIDLYGRATPHDSIKPSWSASLPSRQQSPLLEELGEGARAANIQEEFADSPPVKLQQTSTEGAGVASLSDQWNLIANQPALKIAVRADGWYRITQPEMAAAGFNTSADTRNLRLFVGGNEIAVGVSRASGALTPSDYIEFWGQGLDTPTTDTQIYWLVNGAQAGKRIATTGEVHTEETPVDKTTPPVKKTTQDIPIFLFPGLMGRASVGEQRVVSNDQPVLPESAVESSAEDLRQNPEDVEQNALGGKRKAARVEQSVLPASAGESAPSGSKSQFKIQDSTSETNNSTRGANNSKLETRSSKIERHRRHRIRSRARRNHKPLPRRNHATFALAAAPNFINSVQLKDRSIYFTQALNGDQENFFGSIVNATSAPLTLTLRSVETTSAATAQIAVALQGVSLQSHQVNVLINNNLAGTINYLYQDAASQTFSVPLAWLLEGANSIKLLETSGSNNLSLVDYVRIIYPHSFKADNDSLQFSVKSTLSARIDGFTTQNIRVVDISDPANVQLVHPIVETSSSGFALTVQPIGRTKGRRLAALPSTQLSHPASLTLNIPSTLNANTNAADLVVISYKDFIPSLTTTQPPSAMSFVALRSTQYVVKVVDVEDVFDEFSYGVHSPQAIRDFLALATTTWSTHPRYVMLVGDASYDPRNFFGKGNFDFVPSKEIDTGFKNDTTALETASDDWLTDFNGDGIADISIGRLPVRTLAEANLIIGKIVNYLPANQTQSALLVADTQGTYYWNFEQSDDLIANQLPSGLAKQKIYRRLEPSDAQTNIDIANQINAGQALVVYSGHGNVNTWAGSIFATDDSSAVGGRGAMSLTNGNKLPFVVVMDCLNGYYTDPVLQSLGEAFLKAPNGGAVASFASSGLTIPDGQHAMGQKMLDLLYPADGSTIPIGDASRLSKAFANDIDVERTWILFGDPTMKIR